MTKPSLEERGAGQGAGGPLKALVRELARIRLAVWVIIAMFVTMIVGSVFPQGYDSDTYIKSWGEAKYQVLAKWGLLNLFRSKYFIVLGVILLLNLVFCSVVRWFGRGGAGLAGDMAPSHAREMDLGGAPDAAAERVKGVLASRGYKVLGHAGGVITARRGPWPEGVSLLYHLAMALAIVGFVISALFAFEGDATLWPGEPVKVPTVSRDAAAFKLGNRLADWSVGGWHPFAGARGDTSAWAGREVTLTLKEFRTEWEFYNEKHYPKDWFSDVKVRLTGPNLDRTWLSRTVEVNRPLRVGGLTFYQMAYEQEFDVVVSKDGTEIERVPAQAYVPFTLTAIGGMFSPGTLRVGTLFEKYREPVPMVPHVELTWQKPAVAGADSALAPGEETEATPGAEATAGDEAAEPEPVELGRLSTEEPLVVEGHTLLLENPREASVLSYRHDPGVALLYIAITAFIVGLAIRTYWPSYRVNLWIEEAPGGAKGRMAFRATGMLGEPAEIEEGLARALASRA